MLLKITEDLVIDPDHLTAFHATGHFDLATGQQYKISPVSPEKFLEIFKKLNCIHENDNIENLAYLAKKFVYFICQNLNCKVLINKKSITRITPGPLGYPILWLLNTKQGFVVDCGKNKALKIINAADQPTAHTTSIDVQISADSLYKIFGVTNPSEELKDLLNKQGVSHIELKFLGTNTSTYVLKHMKANQDHHIWTCACSLKWQCLREYSHVLYLNGKKYTFGVTTESWDRHIDNGIVVKYY